MSKYRFLVNSAFFTIIDYFDVCVHDYPKLYCPTCLTSTLPILKNMQDYISKFILTQKITYYIDTINIYGEEKFKYGLTELKINNPVAEIIFYIVDDSDEFLFGFLSAIYHKYESIRGKSYWEKYVGRSTSLRTFNYMINIPNSTILKHKNGSCKFLTLTTDTKEFMKGWSMGVRIEDIIRSEIGKHVTSSHVTTPEITDMKIADVNQLILDLRKDHLEKVYNCTYKCYKNLIKCPTCTDTRLIDNDCVNCRSLLSNSSFEDIPCLRCSIFNIK